MQSRTPSAQFILALQRFSPSRRIRHVQQPQLGDFIRAAPARQAATRNGYQLLSISVWQEIAADVAREKSTQSIKSISEALTLDFSAFPPLTASVPSSQGKHKPCTASLARTAQSSASQEFQDLIGKVLLIEDDNMFCVVKLLPDILLESSEQRLTVLVCAERRLEESMLVFARAGT